jgi:hypothetical protein
LSLKILVERSVNQIIALDAFDVNPILGQARQNDLSG